MGQTITVTRTKIKTAELPFTFFPPIHPPALPHTQDSYRPFSPPASVGVSSVDLVEGEILVNLGHVGQVALAQLEPEDLVHERVLVADNALVLAGRDLVDFKRERGGT